MIDVVELTEQHAAAYASFVPRTALTAIYGTIEFKTFLAESVGGTPAYRIAVRDERIVGALPLFVAQHAEWGRVLNSLPWYGSHGGCLLADPSDREAREALLESIRPLWNAPDVAFATVILSHAETAGADDYRSVLQPQAIDDRDGQVTVLPPNGADLESRLEKTLLQKTRNLVRKSLRQDFVLDDGDNDAGWDYLVATHHENLAAIGGKAKPRAHFDAIRRSFPPEWRRLLIARAQGQAVAALLLLRFGSTVEYLTPVISQAYRAQQPMSFLIWHGMLESVRAGFQWWNWGGTWKTQESLFHFKAGWGAQSWTYQYLCRGRADALASLRFDAPRAMDAFPYYFLYPLNG